MEPEKHDSPFQRKKNNMPANKSIQARQQLRDPNTGRFRDEHRQSGMPTDESIRKYEQQPRPPLPPPHHRSTPTPSESKTSELQNHSGGRKTRLHAHRARRAGPDTRHETSHAIPIPPPPPSDWKRRYRKISTSRRWKRSPTIWRHGEPVPMRNVANTMRRSHGWRHPEPD